MDKQNGGADSDQDFDPTAEMLVNDFDDEHTLEEEEALESGESVGNELTDLQKEGEMPLDDLLAMYGYTGNRKTSPTKDSPIKDFPPEVAPVMVTETAPALVPPTTLVVPEPTEPSQAPTPPEERLSSTIPKTNEKVFLSEGPPSTRHLLRACKSVSQPSESSGSESDDDGSPDDDWRKTIQVGSDYQASVPEGLSKYDGAPPYENEDRLLWDPTKLQDRNVEEYLHQAQQVSTNLGPGVYSIPLGSHIKDDEQALYLLLQCGHNLDEALRRRRMQPSHGADTMSLWSEDECRSFENGLRTYGKDFHLIQLNKVRTRSVGELIQFYYLWKKTERHDVFASKSRLEKKKYALHPGTTDYMDRFLDEQENPTAHRDRSSSPNLQSLYNDTRKTPQGCGSNRTLAGVSSPPITQPNHRSDEKHLWTRISPQSTPSGSLLSSAPNENYRENKNGARESERNVLNGVDNKPSALGARGRSTGPTPQNLGTRESCGMFNAPTETIQEATSVASAN